MTILRVVLAVVALIYVHPAHAQAPPPESPERLRGLIATLENDAERAKLIDQLKQLLAAQEAQKKPPAQHGAAARVIGDLSDRIERLSASLVEGAAVLIDAPRLVQWLRFQLGDPDARSRSLAIAWKVLAVLAAGVLAEWVARRLLGRARRAIEARSSDSFWIRVVYLIAWAVLDLAPIAAFAAAAYAVLPSLEPSETTRLIALALVNAVVLARVVVTLAQILFMPWVEGLRILPFDAEDASYAYVWVRRLAYVAIYGWVLAEAALLLGLPAGGHQALIKLVGLAVLLLVVVLILQTRQSLAAWLRGKRPESAPAARGWRALRERLADIWHVLAIVYAAALYVVWSLELRSGFDHIARASLLTIVILVAARLIAQGVRDGLGRIFAISEDLRRRYPGLETRANRYLAVVESVAIACIYVIAAFAVLAAWGIDSMAWLSGELGQRLAGRAILIAALIVGAVIVWELINASIERTLTRDGRARIGPRARTLLPLARSVALIVLTTLTIFTVLSEIGLDIGPLLAGAGVIGLAVGFGSQTLVKDIVTGVFILSENQVSVGDTVKIGDHQGQVEAITIRTMRLRDPAGAMHIIPFSEVQTIENMTRDFSRHIFHVRVAEHEDIDAVIAALREIGAAMEADPALRPRLVGGLEVLGIEEFDDNAMVVLGQITTRAGEQAAVGREFNLRLKKAFDERGIALASPRRTVYFGEARRGEAPPLRVQVIE
jgi:small conductance mechanosensitive channel